MARILVVDDELSIVQVLRTLLLRAGHAVSSATNGEDARKLLKDNVFDLLITDVRLPGVNGISLLQEAKGVQPEIAVMVMTAYADVDSAVEAMKHGAFDYITKPFKFDELMLTIERALNYEKALSENKMLKSSIGDKLRFGCMVGDSDAMLEVYRQIEKIAKTNGSVMLLGESGTGKELVARSIHTESPRRNCEFVAVNCAAMPETLLESELFGYVKGAFTGATANRKGLFETANGGTIFLDEIGSLPLGMQSKLLRVLQDKEIRPVGATSCLSVDVRVISATNEDLLAKIQNGSFREDLYFRISVIPLKLPSLNERTSDVPALVDHFLESFAKENNRKVEISNDALAALKDASWPGNVRQLENMVKRLATLNETGRIELSELPKELLRLPSTPEPVEENPLPEGAFAPEVVPLKQHIRGLEEDYVKRVIKHCEGDKELAARKLGVSLATLYRKIDPNSTPEE